MTPRRCLRLEDGELVPIVSEGLSADAMGRRFPLKEQPRLEIICRSEAAGDVSRATANCPIPTTDCSRTTTESSRESMPASAAPCASATSSSVH